MTISFIDLPCELALMIGRATPGRDIFSLSRTARSLYNLFHPMLYSQSVLYYGRETLRWAMEKDDANAFRALHEAGAQADAKYLLIAAEYGSEAVTKLLLVELLHATDDDLHECITEGLDNIFAVAAERGWEKVLKVYLDHPTIYPWRMRKAIATGIRCALKAGKTSTLGFLLRQEQLVVGITVGEIWRTLYETFKGARRRSAPTRESMQLLLDDGRFSKLVTPLAMAAYDGDAEAIAGLVKRGEGLGRAVAGGMTPLAIAAACGRPGAVRALLEAPDIDDSLDDDCKSTALLYSVGNNDIECARLLLAHRKDDGKPRSRNRNGQTALCLAIRRNWTEGVEMLIDYGRTTDLASVKDTIPFEYGVTGMDMGFMGPVCYAAYWARRDVLRLLYNTGRFDFGERSGNGMNAMAFAVIGGPPTTPERVEDETDTVVSCEAAEREGVVESLLEIGEEKGIDWQVRDATGRTPLDHALHLGHEEIVMLLRRQTKRAVG